MSDSKEPGYLTPLGDVPPDDDGLLDLLQPVVSGITGIDGTLVRPRWQPDDTPNMPDYKVDWLALGIARTRPETFHFEGHVDEGEGFDNLITSEEVDLLLSFYGPGSQSLARRLSYGIRLGQNRAPLQAVGMDVLYCGDPVTLPALLTGRWVRRVDLTVTMRRRLVVPYGVRTIVELPGAGAGALGLDNELYVTPILVEGAP